MKAENVSLNVQSDVSLNRQAQTESPPSKSKRTKSPGRYLVRNGNTILFQMRVPELSGKPHGCVIRLSLGALSLREARIIADELASLVRSIQRKMRCKMTDEHRSDENSTEFIDQDDSLLEMNAAFLNYIMKSAVYEIKNAKVKLNPEVEIGQKHLRNIVQINREVEAKQRGEDYNELTADNADVLIKAIGEKWLADMDASGQTTENTGIEVESTGSLSALPYIWKTEPEQSDASTPPPAKKPAPQKEKKPKVYAFEQDRRYVERKKSDKPLFSEIASEYFAVRELVTSKKNKDIKTARTRADMFIELIGDHPVDTYTGTDLQAFIGFLKYWPSNNKLRDVNKTAREIIKDNHDLHLKPIAWKTLSDGYIAIIKAAINFGQTKYDYSTPISHAKLAYPDTARPSVAAEPLSAQKIELLLKAGVETGYLDHTMLPLLGLLTGRRLGLLVHLKGSDIREKYQGVWVAQTNGC